MIYINLITITLFTIAALNDLNKVLRLTDCKGRTACHALCQRGSLKRKQEDIEGAKEDFSIAAKLGSQFARNQVRYLIK